MSDKLEKAILEGKYSPFNIKSYVGEYDLQADRHLLKKLIEHDPIKIKGTGHKLEPYYIENIIRELLG